jgi:hypothetical protein
VPLPVAAINAATSPLNHTATHFLLSHYQALTEKPLNQTQSTFQQVRSSRQLHIVAAHVPPTLHLSPSTLSNSEAGDADTYLSAVELFHASLQCIGPAHGTLASMTPTLPPSSVIHLGMSDSGILVRPFAARLFPLFHFRIPS